MGVVKRSVTNMEEQVGAAEDNMGSLSAFKKVINNFSLPFFSSVSLVSRRGAM